MNDHVKGFYATLNLKLDTAPSIHKLNIGNVPIYILEIIKIGIPKMLK